MNCNKFINLIPKFIDNELNEDSYDTFLSHVKECKECREELEIHYMIRVGLERIEEDSSKSFDIKGELNSKLKLYEKRADKIFKKNIYTKIVIFSAEGCSFITCTIYLLKLMGII